MSEMIERVARALCAKTGRDWESQLIGDATEMRQQHFKELARAAIAAMREPTLSMVAAGNAGAIDPSPEHRERPPFFAYFLGSSYQAMIDKALE